MGLLNRFHVWFALGLRVADVFVMVATLFLLAGLYEIPWDQSYSLLAILSALLLVLVMGAVGLYRPWRGAQLLAEARTMLTGWLIVLGLLLFIAFVTKATSVFSRVVIGGWSVLAPFAMLSLHLVGRSALRWLRRHGHNFRTAVIVGAGGLGRDIAQRIQSTDWMGVRLLGFFDDDPAKQRAQLGGLPVLGETAALKAYVNRYYVNQVYVALPSHADERVKQILSDLQDTTAAIYYVPDIFMFGLLGSRPQDVGGIPVLSIGEPAIAGPFGLLKRIEDIVVATLALAVTAPLMLVIVIAIKLTSPGLVFFKQRRYGIDGKEFSMWKFRTMTVCEEGRSAVQAVRNDPRVTPVGRFLRRTSLDELPQFFNVLKGTMSVVGPRPHPVALNEQYRGLINGYMWRHKIKPGITGWAQVNGLRGETDTLDKMKRRIEYDMVYIRQWTLWLDLRIIFQTVASGFTNRNAY